MERLVILLSGDEIVALRILASGELRGLREQVRCIVQADLHRRGLLPIQQGEGNSSVSDETDDQLLI